jgi:DNA-binding transcriptional MerR regulator
LNQLLKAVEELYCTVQFLPVKISFVKPQPENSKFTASDARKVAGVTYRQLNDWDLKGALPSQRRQISGWRKFDPKQFFVILVCAEIRKQFGVPIEKLASLQKLMLQDGADHFSAALKMMRHGLAVLILTDLSQQFDMDADFAIAELLGRGYCRYDKPQSYVLLLVNPIVNKMLKALKEPMRLEITDIAYNALIDAQAVARARDLAELEVLKLMRQPNISKITVTQTNDKEALLEIDENGEGDAMVQRGEDQVAPIFRKVMRRVTKEAIDVIAARIKD